MFLPKLQALADQQSPTMLALLERKKQSYRLEYATDPDYLRGAFAVISEYYISAIDRGDIQFKDDYERGEFLWMLQLMVDYAASGRRICFPSRQALKQNTKSATNRSFDEMPGGAMLINRLDAALKIAAECNVQMVRFKAILRDGPKLSDHDCP